MDIKTDNIYFPEIKSIVTLEEDVIEPSILTFYFQNPKEYKVYLDCTEIGIILFYSDSDYTIIFKEKDIEQEDFVNNTFETYFKDILQNEDLIKIGYPVKLNIDHMRTDYMSLMLEAEILLAIRTGRGVNYAYTQYERVAKWLNTKDFFIAPASTRFHESEEGGLLKHSLTVYNYICDLKKTDTFKDVDIAEMTICALTHDWCKIERYEKYMRNVKDEETGKWHQEASYRIKQSDLGYPYPFGHGETSVYIVNQFFRNLSMDASLAIRWHMNSYYTHEAIYNDLYDAKVYHPQVLMLITADELALTHY